MASMNAADFLSTIVLLDLNVNEYKLNFDHPYVLIIKINDINFEDAFFVNRQEANKQ